MKLSSLLQDIPATFYGNAAAEVTGITDDSRRAERGVCFVAVKGANTDGHRFIAAAAAGGAAALVCETLPDNHNALLEANPDLCIVQTPNTAEALGKMAAEFYGNPSRKLKLVGVTGTNGKTTVATLLYELFEHAGCKAGLISTVIYKIHLRTEASTHTTPDALRLNALLAEMVNEGCTYCFMEVSSHAIAQRRIAGLQFTGGIFTNLTHDHLDYHHTFAEYRDTKKRFFDDLPPDAFALTNVGDRNGSIMTQNTKAAVHTYSLVTLAEFKCRIVEKQMDGMLLEINGRQVWTLLIGAFNACNVCAVYAAATLLLGIESNSEAAQALLTAVSMLKAVAGRFEYVRAEDGTVAIVDYAHTPDALQNVLDTINDLRGNGAQSIITLVGCGGDRDKTKRPVMARIAAECSDRVILTSDNPRTEDPEAILCDMTAGLNAEEMRKVLVIADRHSAIRTAAALANSGDLILIAGKGHEDYQITGTVKRHFDDREEIRKAFDDRKAQMV